jgi:hypothetical protein
MLMKEPLRRGLGKDRIDLMARPSQLSSPACTIGRLIVVVSFGLIKHRLRCGRAVKLIMASATAGLHQLEAMRLLRHTNLREIQWWEHQRIFGQSQGHELKQRVYSYSPSVLDFLDSGLLDADVVKGSDR